MRPLASILLAGVLASACGADAATRPTADAATRRTTTAGDVVGFVGGYGSHVWLGIPFAAPPIGERRWRSPAPPDPWRGVRDALEAGAPCPQYASPLGGIQTAPANTPVGDESCLYLNVYAPPTATASSRLPVMVWIHGGGNAVGAGHLYDGGNLAATEDVVVVTVNYRLGPFGWFRHAGLRAGAPTAEERSGNFALLDLVQALAWVRDNAAAFGGDPGRVTIFGESAGGRNVLALLQAPPARGLFHRAIVESGGLGQSELAAAERRVDETPPGDRNSSNEVLVRLLVADGSVPDRSAAVARLSVTTAEEVGRYLRGKSTADVLGAYEPLPHTGLVPLPNVFPDGAVLPAAPALERFARPDGWNRVPTLIGTNRDESKLFMFFDPRWVRRWFWIVPRLRDPARYEATAEILSRMWKAAGADEVATALRQGGGTAFVYRFDWDEEPTVLGADLSTMIGAAHGLEIPFVFGHFDFDRGARYLFDAASAPGRAALSASVMSYWAAFADTGSPGSGRRGELPPWPAWGDPPAFLVLDTPAGGGIHRSTETLTRERVLAAVDTDPRLATLRDRCIVYHELARRDGALTREAYDAKCRDLVLDAYPWDG